MVDLTRSKQAGRHVPRPPAEALGALPRVLDPLEGASWDRRRIERRLLTLRNRRRIVDHVADNPGIHLRKVARDLDLALGTAEHHLHLLVRHGLLEVDEAQGQSCYFTPGTPPEDRLLWVVLRQDAQRRVLRLLAADPDLAPAELGRRLALSKAAVAYHLQRLEAWGFVERLRLGRQRLLRVTRPERLAEVLAALDDGRPSLPWPGLLLSQTAARPVRRTSETCTPCDEEPTGLGPALERVDARVRSSSA
jgi:DNA-binding transcriptional ArsR family regulator